MSDRTDPHFPSVELLPLIPTSWIHQLPFPQPWLDLRLPCCDFGPSFGRELPLVLIARSNSELCLFASSVRLVANNSCQTLLETPGSGCVASLKDSASSIIEVWRALDHCNHDHENHLGNWVAGRISGREDAGGSFCDVSVEMFTGGRVGGLGLYWRVWYLSQWMLCGCFGSPLSIRNHLLQNCSCLILS